MDKALVEMLKKGARNIIIAVVSAATTAALEALKSFMLSPDVQAQLAVALPMPALFGALYYAYDLFDKYIHEKTTGLFAKWNGISPI